MYLSTGMIFIVLVIFSKMVRDVTTIVLMVTVPLGILAAIAVWIGNLFF